MQDSDSLLPLVIGVTGHRNPAVETVAALEGEVEQRLRWLDALAPNTPFIMLTPLALGCDRIAARVALRFKRSRPDRRIEIVGVLPFTLDDYRRDFTGDAADAAEFEDLLSKVDSWLELPRAESAEIDARGFVTRQEDRDTHYRRLGLFVAHQSQVMIAMWDGVANQKVGGTAEVVEFCRGNRIVGENCGVPFRSTPMLLVRPTTTPFYHVVTRRDGEPPTVSLQRATDALESQPAGQHAAADLARMLGRLDFLNRHLASIAVCALASTDTPEWAANSPQIAEPWARLVARQHRLDELARASKKEFARTAWLIPLVAATGIAGFQWYASFAGDHPHWAWIAIALYALCLVVASGLWYLSKHRARTEEIFVHGRAISEAMRIQIAWTGSGVFDVATDRYSARRSGEVGFLQAQLRAANLESLIIAARAAGSGAAGALYGENWIKSQHDYFQGPRQHERAERVDRLELVERWLWRGVFALSFALLATACVEAAGWSGVVEETTDWICFLVALSIASTVAFSYWNDAMLEQEDLEEAHRMKEVFARAQQLLGQRRVSTAEIIRAVGLEALDEHADWYVRHRDRLRLPDAG